MAFSKISNISSLLGANVLIALDISIATTEDVFPFAQQEAIQPYKKHALNVEKDISGMEVNAKNFVLKDST